VGILPVVDVVGWRDKRGDLGRRKEVGKIAVGITVRECGTELIQAALLMQSLGLEYRFYSALEGKPGAVVSAKDGINEASMG
jgi:hypothetical protein